MSSHDDDEPDRSTGSVTGHEDDHRNEETEDQSVQEQQEMTDEPKVSLEDGELEDGELDDDDDGSGGGGGGGDGATLDNAGNSEPISENAADAQSHLTGVAPVVEKSGKSSATNLSQPKKKEIPSLFDLKTTKPKSLKHLTDIQGNKSYLQYVDHDRMDEDYYNTEEVEMTANAWPRYQMPDDDYTSSEGDQEPEDEFSVEIQQMLNRSAATSHGPGDKSPRGPYDSPSEDEDDDDAERPPPAKIPRVDYDGGDGDDDDGCTSYGDVTKGNRKTMKKSVVTTNGRMNDGGDDSYQKKSKVILSRSNKHGEQSGGVPILEVPLLEKRRLMDTPMEERPQCKFFLEAKCKKGSNCPFNHDLPWPKKQDVCRYFLAGRQCGMGKDCPFSHDVRGISGEDNDCKSENMMQKKKKALLGSPPLQSRMIQSKDKRKIPSLFDIQINAEGPNAKEILQSAARRSVMQTSNPKPGLLGVAPPMAAAGMIGSMNRMRFPPMGQGFFDGFNRPHLPQKLESQSHLHSKEEEFGLDNLAHGPQNPNLDFMPPSEIKENGLLQNVSYLNQNVEFLGRMDGPVVDEMPKNNLSSDFISMPNFPGLTAAVSSAISLPPPNYSTMLNSMPVQPQPNLPIPGNFNDPSTMIQSLIPPPDLPSFAPQFGGLPQSLLPSQPAVNEAAELQRSAASPLSNAGDAEKPQVVGGVDVNHLPPKQRELYLRIFAQQKEVPSLPPDQISSDRPREKDEENLAMQPAAGAITGSSDLLKFLVPSQVSSQPSLPNSHVSAQPSSNSSFNITQMLSAICADGIPNISQLSAGTGPISAENHRRSDVVFEVSGSSLRGPYRLEPVTLDTNAITLPSFIDPKDSKYSSDPRVQKHKDDVVVVAAAVVHREDNNKQPVVVAQTDVPFRAQRRDPRLARKETAGGKEEAVHPNQDAQPRLSALGGTSLGAAVSSGALSLGNTGIPPPGVPMGSMNHSGLPLSSIPMDVVPQQNGMSMAGLQHGGMMVGNMQLGGIPGGIHIGSSQSTGMTGAGGGMNANVPMAGMQHGGMIIGGLQQGNHRAPSGIQSLMSMGMQMAGMQGNPPIGTMQQCGPNLGGISQGGMSFGGMHQGGLQPGSLPLGGAVSQSILPLAAGLAMNAMQQQGSLLQQLSGGLLQQRGLLPPPFLSQNQMSSMNNAFQHVSNLIRAQMPFNPCPPPPVFSAEMAQHESSGATGSVGSNVSFPNTMQSAPSIPRPLLPFQQPPVNVQMLGQSCSEPPVQLSSSPSPQTAPSDTGIPSEPVVGTIQPLLPTDEISGSSDPAASETNADQTFLSSENSPASRTVGYRDDPRFKIKKARNADDTTENSLMSDDSPAPDSPLASELDVESRRAILRNRDKLEFRSPLADMGDGAGSSQSSGYNQPPNRKYQQMAEEENSSRRSAAPSKTTKDGFKARRTGVRQPQKKQAPVAPVFENLRTSHDVVAEDVAPAVQSVKDMFKSIDPTASPFC